MRPRSLPFGAHRSAAEIAASPGGFLGLSDKIRKGYQNIRVRMRVKSTAKPDTLRELATFSPVYDVVSNSVPVDFVVETY